jgi:hypothetical protein
MPNWCNNVATLNASKGMIDKIVEGATGDGVLQSLLPCPQDLLIEKGYFADTDKQAALEAQGRANVEKYGYADWYDWRVANWGTKWDLCDVAVNRVDDETVTLTFDTAWSPPIEAYDKLLCMGIAVNAFYYEPGMAFCGQWEDGFDTCCEFGGETSATVRAAVGDEIDDMFNISGSMAEWEEDNDEREEVQVWYEDGVKKLENQ